MGSGVFWFLWRFWKLIIVVTQVGDLVTVCLLLMRWDGNEWQFLYFGEEGDPGDRPLWFFEIYGCGILLGFSHVGATLVSV